MVPSVILAGINATAKGCHWSEYTTKAIIVVMRPVSYEEDSFQAQVIQIPHKLAFSS